MRNYLEEIKLEKGYNLDLFYWELREKQKFDWVGIINRCLGG